MALSEANLAEANFLYATLTRSDLSQANLEEAYFGSATLSMASLSDALVTRTSFVDTTKYGFTKEHLYSTASYKSKDLAGIGLDYNDLSGWNFAGQNLAGANFDSSTLTSADLSQANLANVSFVRATLTNADLGQANLAGAYFYYATLARADLSQSKLAGAYLNTAMLRSADLTGADLRGARSADLTGAITRNMIWHEGQVIGLDLSGRDKLLVRDYDGNPNQSSPPIAISVVESMAVSDSGTLKFMFEADPWDSLISFEPGIPVQLGGTLELTFADEMDVGTQIGRTFDIFDWTGVQPTGEFSVASEYLWDLSNLYSTGKVRLTGTGGKGDYDGSGLVEQGDLDHVLLNWGLDGSTPPAVWSNDLPTEIVDQAELDKVLINWGRTTTVVGAASVPEPATGILALFAVVMLALILFRPDPRIVAVWLAASHAPADSFQLWQRMLRVHHAAPRDRH